MNKNDIKIRNEVHSRGITALYHFTSLSNLESILKNGIISRKILDENNIPYEYTDDKRLDDNLNASSVSIHGINYSMFKGKIAKLPRRWVIVEIQPSILWTHRCDFCWINAADAEILDHCGYRGGPWAFRKMFDDAPVSRTDDSSHRAHYKTAANSPTFSDAEVQVHGIISPDLIRDVTIAHECDRKRTEAAMENAKRSLPIAINPEAFRV